MKTLSLLYGLIIVLCIVSMWVIFTKAKKPGWASIIPLYNIIVLLEIVGKPWWWLILMLIPVVNIVIMIIVMHKLSEAFGQGVGFTIGLILIGFIFLPLLAFGNYNYNPPAKASVPNPAS
ncbi:MAG TPA: DUF5684 domain-containing protein [Cyclobacteriaceae bacterium]|nr:DUF5684 domain-containing protein [Cyclobacteriaceae bacterium]